MPRGIHIAAVLCLILSGVTGMFAASEASSLTNFSELRERASTERLNLLGDPAVEERFILAQLSALEPMRDSRILTLGALAIACAFTFVAAGRMLRPAGLPREGMRRMLGGVAIIAAILRTIDGAQWMVVVKRSSTAMAEAMSTLPQFQDPTFAQQLKSTVPILMSAITLAQTAVIAGAFVLIGQYFHSARVREAITAQDGPAE
ncbi:hypothetical protein [Hyalangium rubrum]|uniref:DUF2975 domain-containing protein n=1 Tax=Hyalangium rubrum TaxID=3103134 RepID=A0ABU5HCN6_9BACT|nr:hypothetical protein [Hyalangium sp. s54d21]MDY7230593.1 hypothetical protein [Hyalangium sp. s54d21]